MTEIPKAQHRPMAQPLAYYAKNYDNPREAMAVAYSTGGYTLKAIADEFGVHYSTVSRVVAQFEEDFKSQ
jgi:transposase